MRLTALSLLVPSAAALVLPDGPLPASQHSRPQQPIAEAPAHHGDEGAVSSSWWDKAVASGEDFLSAFEESVDSAVTGANRVAHDVVGAAREMHDDIVAELDVLGGGDHDTSDKTIYQLIQECDHTSKFAELVDEHKDVVKLLNSTGSQNLTLFVPINAAFDDIPDDHEKPGKDVIEAVLKYHIGLGEYRAKRILGTNTIPTAYDEHWLGDEPQRLRTGVDLKGVHVNFYSRVVAADMTAKNGVIHGVRSILAPPPMIGRIISLFPAEFSTLLLAYEKTDFVKFVHGVKMTGSTVFAPSNRAFASLGVKVNAFLFNTEKGLKYLNALLKYHIAPNATLYSDAFYDKTGEKDADEDAGVDAAREHYDLGTLLGDARVGVDKAKFAGFTIIKVNGFSNVVIRDAPGKNGVIHVVDKVLIPACKHKKHDQEEIFADGEMSVEEFMERLSDYVEDDSASENLEL